MDDTRSEVRRVLLDFGVIEDPETTLEAQNRADDLVDALALAASRRVRAEYQRFYNFVADVDISIVDAWHFGENFRFARELRSGE